MKRAEIQGPGQYPAVASYPDVPDPPPRGALIQTTFCGICHSDIHMWEKAKAGSNFPIVYGHEVAGTILSFGENAEHGHLAIGDNVMVFAWVGCGECPECKTGNDNLCMDRSQETGCGADGGYSSHVCVRDTKFLVKIPESIPVDVACMLPCSGLTTYSALAKVRWHLQKSPAKEKLYVLVVGAGGLGLWCLQWIKHRLPKGTVAISADICVEKLATARKHGADDTILWSMPKSGDLVVSDSLVSEIERKTNGKRFNAVLDFVNSSVTAERGHASLKKGGMQVGVGLFGGQLTLNLENVVRRVTSYAGSYTGSLDELKELVQFVTEVEIKPPPISHYSLEEVANVWKLLEKGKISGRAIIKY